jgi:hypothetical protein
VRYVDYKTLEENQLRYPEHHDRAIVATDIIDDGFVLRSIAPESVDFIVANHALEHSPNLYGTLRNWASKLAGNGLLFVTVPIAENCYDQGRPITSMEHFLADDQDFQEGNVPYVLRGTLEHLVEFLAISDRCLRLRNGMPIPSWREILGSAESLMARLEARIEATLSVGNAGWSTGHGDLIMTCHVEQVNRVYDVHYHTFTPRSYYDLLSYFCKSEGFRLQDYRESGAGECIGIVRKAG